MKVLSAFTSRTGWLMCKMPEDKKTRHGSNKLSKKNDRSDAINTIELMHKRQASKARCDISKTKRSVDTNTNVFESPIRLTTYKQKSDRVVSDRRIGPCRAPFG